MKKSNIADSLIKIIRDAFAIVGLAITGYVIVRSVMMYPTIATGVYCGVALLVIGIIGVRAFFKITKRQLIQKRNLKHERLLTYHK